MSNVQESASAVRAHIEAFNSRDVEALMAGFADDPVWITGETVVRGSAELAELFTNAMEGLLPVLTMQSLIAEGDQAACQMTEKIVCADGERTYSIAAFYRLVDGRIKSAKVYREGNATID